MDRFRLGFFQESGRRFRIRLAALVALLTATVAAATWSYWPRDDSIPTSAFGGPQSTVYVVPVKPVSDEAVRVFAAALGGCLPARVVVASEWVVDERHTLAHPDDRFNAALLVERLIEITPDGVRAIGITDQEMGDERYRWLFGKSRWGGRTAVVSTRHMWVDPARPDVRHPRFAARLARVGVHELGHTLGLHHCENARCAMKVSATVWELDRTRPTFCAACVRAYFE